MGEGELGGQRGRVNWGVRRRVRGGEKEGFGGDSGRVRRRDSGRGGGRRVCPQRGCLRVGEGGRDARERGRAEGRLLNAGWLDGRGFQTRGRGRGKGGRGGVKIKWGGRLARRGEEGVEGGKGGRE